MTVVVLVGGFLAVWALVRLLGRVGWVFSPVVVFLMVDMATTWPTLALSTPEFGLRPLLLAICGCAWLVMAFAFFGGYAVDVSRWKEGRWIPDLEESRKLGLGIIVLVAVLSAIALWRFQGLPPLATGGFASLLDPVANADQVAAIREGRRTLTKGYLVGEDYAGQGFFNGLSEIGWLFAVIASVLRFAAVRDRKSLALALVVCLLAFVVVGSTGKRAPLVVIAVGAVAALNLRRRFKPTTWTALGMGGFLFLLLISPLSKGANAGTTWASRQEAVIERVFAGNGANNVAIMRLVDFGALDPGYGTVFMGRFLALIPGAPSEEPFALKLTRLAYGATDSTTGFATPTQFGLLYADGMDFGVVLGYLLTGVVIAMTWRLTARFEGMIGAVLTIHTSLLLAYLSLTGIHGLLSSTLFTILLWAVVEAPGRLSDALGRRSERRRRSWRAGPSPSAHARVPRGVGPRLPGVLPGPGPASHPPDRSSHPART